MVGEGVAVDPAKGADARTLSFKVQDLNLPPGVDTRQADARLGLLNEMRQRLLVEPSRRRPREPPDAYLRAVRLMRRRQPRRSTSKTSPRGCAMPTAGPLSARAACWPAGWSSAACRSSRSALARPTGGQGIGWDTHQQNFETVKKLSGVLDPAWADADGRPADRGLLESTLIVWMGEFGRTPKINPQAGRDHFPAAWTTVLAGGGIKGGQVIGSTSADGMKVEDRPVTVPDFLATVCKALGIDPMAQNHSNVGRPIRIADPEAKPIVEALA